MTAASSLVRRQLESRRLVAAHHVYRQAHHQASHHRVGCGYVGINFAPSRSGQAWAQGTEAGHAVQRIHSQALQGEYGGRHLETISTKSAQLHSGRLYAYMLVFRARKRTRMSMDWTALHLPYIIIRCKPPSLRPANPSCIRICICITFVLRRVASLELKWQNGKMPECQQASHCKVHPKKDTLPKIPISEQTRILLTVVNARCEISD